MCVMELSAFLAGEPHSDAPVCVSPVIRAFLVSWNDSLDDDGRQMLKPYAARVLGTRILGPEGAKLEEALTRAVNMLGVGPQGLGGDSTAFAVHVETAATHITMNPVAVNMQCHSARRARATLRPGGFEYGY